jgi:hypothetical protein
MTSVAQAIAGELVGWSGLPSGFDEQALRSEIAADWRFEPRAGERLARSFGILRAASTGKAGSLEAWIPTGGTVLSSLEFRPDPSIDHAAILADLGEPELVLRSSRYEPGALVREHVHAGRGVTVAVAEPFADEAGRTPPPYIVFVQLYEPGPTTDFVTRVGQSGVEVHPYPR